MPISNRHKNQFFIDDVQVYADYSKSASKRYERPDKRVFHRESLNGALTLLRTDFKKIINQALNHEFSFKLNRYNGTGFTNYINGKFHKTDCEFDEDRQITKVNVNSIDQYEKLLTSIDKEFDLVQDLKPPTHNVKYKKYPLLQLAWERHGEMVNITGENLNILEMPYSTGEELESYGFFRPETTYAYIPGTNDMVPDVSGVYSNATGAYVRLDGQYQIATIFGLFGFVHVIQVAGGGATKYETAENVPLFGDPTFEERDPTFYGSATFTSVVDGISQCKIFEITPYVRLLTDKTEVDGSPTLPLPAEGEDIGGIVFGYDYYVDPVATPEAVDIVIFSTDFHTTTPNRFGKFHEDALHFAGEYFDEVPGWHALLKTGWREYSLWGLPSAGLEAILDESSSDKSCRDAYELGEVFTHVLGAIDPAIKFKSDIFHSQFFYKTINPISSVEYGLTHFVTAKSNIIIGDYDNPATRGIITFGDLEQLLLAANCYWWINPMGHFIIEHINYFKKGRSYINDIVSNDLTVQIEPKTQKAWAYHTKRYRYKKEAMPERIEFSWMDQVSDLFMGHAIEIISEFVQKGNTESIAVSKFTSDVNYGQVVPQNLSKDGFYILAATEAAGIYTVQDEILDVTGVEPVKVQNGFWSFPHLHHAFHRYNLPAPDVRINETDTTAITTKRAKIQELVYPSPLEPDPMRLVMTSLGLAEIESQEVNLTTREVKLTVLLELDFDNPEFE